ncbi:MAG: trehalose-6-phosphate synthase [Acidobacteriota bacterium]|nr:trehalose-6-phosphate synthase [Acidobacteriota bacterium]
MSLIAGIAVVSYLFAIYQVRSQQQALKGEIVRRSELLAESLDVSVEPLIQSRSHRELEHLIEGFGERVRLVAVVVYDIRGGIEAANSTFAQQLKTVPLPVDQAIAQNKSASGFFTLNHKLTHVYAMPLDRDQKVSGVLAIFTDASDVGAQSASMWRQTFIRILVEMLIIAAITLLVMRWAMAGRIRQMAQWMHDLRAGKSPAQPLAPEQDMFKPLAREVGHLARSLEAARASAQEEARLREAGESLWTPERLRIFIQSKLEGSRLFAVSNREPYEHVRQGKEIACVVPASGLVTALEPILRACEGTWVAHGAGDADPQTVDSDDRLRVPPEDPHYTLRRVWLSKEETEGYYYGFANEGMWPLCHIAHARPTFRAEDWAYYKEVNQKFATAVLEEMEGEERPMVLAQDYHFALLPKMVKDHYRPARVAIFWHIPWPNAEAFGICPWQRELLEGLLGADLIGFHTQSHCNNFLETVDRALESRIDWDRFAVNRAGHITLVRPFPISVDFREMQENAQAAPPGSLYRERSALLREHGVEAAFMGVGVDRIDYTKGILERFHGIERFLERYPSYKGRFTFVQIGAPSRTHIKRYHDLQVDVESEADRINWRFQTQSWRPLIYLKRLHTHSEIDRYYKAADLCMVTSLHDGMNLVAKEFVVSRDDEQGALILSRFTGAARELRDALIVNPYDTEQLAGAIYFALEMDPEERSARMRRMRRVVREHNIYRWAATLISELSEVRLEKPERALRAIQP